MRSLALILFLSLPAFGLTQSLSIQLSTDQRNGPLDVNDLGRQFSISQVSETFGYKAEEIVPALTVEGSLTSDQPDYSSVTILNSDLQAQPVSGPSTEWRAQISTTYAKGNDTASLAAASYLSDSPFASRSLKATYSRAFLNQSTVLGVDALYLQQDEPLSHFLNTELQTVARPTQIDAYSVAFNYDQVLTENWKLKQRVSVSQRLQDRPKNVQVSLKNGYALSDTLFAQLDLSLAEELRSEGLRNERGYFSTRGASVSLSYEPIYDLLIHVSYGLLVENEADPRDGEILQVASDQYGLGLSYLIAGLQVQAQAAYVRTNTSVENIRFSGGLTWPL